MIALDPHSPPRLRINAILQHIEEFYRLFNVKEGDDMFISLDKRCDLWNEKIKNNIIANNGSVQHIDLIPQKIRDKYKTVWEIPMRHLIDMAADRGAFVCQSQSLNLWVEEPNYNTLTSMHFYSWQKGLKTGIYYLRRRARHQAQQFTIEPEKKESRTESIGSEDMGCEMCSA